MPYCPECGKSVAAKAKFCRACGASQLEEDEAPEVVVRPSEMRLCRSCGSPHAPDEIFCANCGAKITDAPEAPPAMAAPEEPEPVPAPAPVASRQIVQICSACGARMDPGIKFCGTCGAPAGLPPAPAPAPVPDPVQAPPAAASEGYVCAGCGSPLTGNEKFCGICGGPAVGARTTPAPAPAPSPAAAPAPAGKFCGTCGAQMSPTARFCGGCGATVGAAPAPAAPPVASSAPMASATPVGGEAVLGVIPNAKKMKMFGATWDTYTIVVTGRRMILAKLTQPMLNGAIAEAQAKAKAEGKGFFGIMGDQMAASFGFGRRYETIPPEQALQETPGNFAIENPRVTAIKLKLIETENAGMDWHEVKMIIETMDGKFEYTIAEDDRFTTLLQTAYGDRVKMPFGLFKAGPVRIKFF